jgi:drug/metabolite transporter (DMT)-like permease
MNNNSEKIINYGLMILLALIWGSSFILMKRGIEVFSFIEVAILRLVIAWLIMVPFIWNKIFSIAKKHWIPLIIVSLFGNGIPAFLFTKAQTTLDSSYIGILNSLVPLFTFLIAIFIFKIKWKTINLIGICIGLIGAIWLISSNGVNFENSNDAWLIIIATICYAISLNTIKNYLQQMKSIDISGLAFMLIGPPCLIALFFTNFFDSVINNPQGLSALFYISILAIFGTAIALIIFNQLVKRTSAIFSSSVTYLIPIVAIGWGIVDGENILQSQLIGVIIIFTGIYLVNKK